MPVSIHALRVGTTRAPNTGEFSRCALAQKPKETFELTMESIGSFSNQNIISCRAKAVNLLSGTMNESPQFPSDENGDVFRRMVRDGDDISKPRMMDFCHIFPERKQALAFAELVDSRELEVCISYYEAQNMWQVTVKRYMIPTYQDVTDMELSLAAKAESLGGEADGWGCMVVETRDTL